jgi:hypothetical protein
MAAVYPSCETCITPVLQQVDVRQATAALIMGGTPSVSYEYATRGWLRELRRSFGSRDRALQQCALDWPRMRVRDERSYVQRAAAYLWKGASDVQIFFANQAALAKPFEVLLEAYPDLLVTQCSAAPVSLLLRADGTLRLDKSAVVWQPDLVPVFRVRISVDVGPLSSTVSFRPVPLV